MNRFENASKPQKISGRLHLIQIEHQFAREIVFDDSLLNILPAPPQLPDLVAEDLEFLQSAGSFSPVWQTPSELTVDLT
jgi:hypothetical protein